MTDMDKLIEAVVAGTATMGSFARVFPSETAYGKTTWGTAHNAFSGSLDAAKALHDALLPEWFYFIMDGCAEVRGEMEYGEQYIGKSNTSARAWLIAILRAYRSQVQK